MIDLFMVTDVLPTFYPQNPDVLKKNVGDSKTDVLGGKVERRNVGPAILLGECRDRRHIPTVYLTPHASVFDRRIVGFRGFV